MTKAPVVLFCYNRPEHTRKTLQALANNAGASETILYVFCDGAKPNATGNDLAKIAGVKEVVRSVQGFKEVIVTESEENLGLARSVIKGVTFVVNKHGQVIVLEDDLVTSAYFLDYMNTALVRYRSDDRVMQVSGYFFDVVPEEKDQTSFFLPFTTSWGWATWDRAWAHFDPDAKGYEELKTNAQLASDFNVHSAHPFSRMLIQQMETKTIDSWAIRWWWTVFQRKGLTLFPAKTLVKNIGFDSEATHTNSGRFEKNELDKESRVSTYPSQIEADLKIWKQVSDYLKQRNTAPEKGRKSWFINIFRK
jgi:hypothetical protein